MNNRIFLAVGQSMLLTAAVYTFKFQLRAELADAEVNALPAGLRNAAPPTQ